MNRTLTARFELDGPLTAADAAEVLLQVPADALLALGERPGPNRPAVIEATWNVPEGDALLHDARDDVPAAGWGDVYEQRVLGPWRSVPCRCTVAPILPDDLAAAAGDVMGLADRGVPLPVIPAQTYADKGNPERLGDGSNGYDVVVPTASVGIGGHMVEYPIGPATHAAAQTMGQRRRNGTGL